MITHAQIEVLDHRRITALKVRNALAIVLADTVISGEPFGEQSVDYEAAVNESNFAEEDFSKAWRAYQKEKK